MNEKNIREFSEDFIRLIDAKNGHIKKLQKEVKRLTALHSLLMKKSEKLTIDEIRGAARPVWVVSKARPWGLYALPMGGGVDAVISASGGRYAYSNYDKTWIAYSDKPEEAEILIDTDIDKDCEYFIIDEKNK